MTKSAKVPILGIFSPKTILMFRVGGKIRVGRQQEPHIYFIKALARMKKINKKIKALEWSQHFSHYRSIYIFPGTQEQPTPQQEVCSGRILN